MTQSEFLEKKQDGLKECKTDLTKEFLKEFDIEMAEYFKTYAQDIRVRIPYSFSKKEVLEIIASKYPDLKLRVRYDIYYYFTPKRKYTIFGREVWI